MQGISARPPIVTMHVLGNIVGMRRGLASSVAQQLYFSFAHVRLHSTKIPFVLCGSRFAPAALHSQHSTDGIELVQKFPELPPVCASKSVVGDNNYPQKVRKRRAFDAIASWCGAHQRLTLQHKGPVPDDITDDTRVILLDEMDEAALNWLQESVEQLSCGQSLLVCSYICEILYCQLSDPTQSTLLVADRATRARIRCFVNKIALLLQQVDESSKLESQPLSVLMSCTYGVRRLASIKSPILDETEHALLKLPHSIIFACVHKLRGESLGKLFQHDEETAIGVCLTFLLIADEEQRLAFSNSDGVLLNNVLRRLVKAVAPSIRKVQEPRELTRAGGASSNVSSTSDNNKASVAQNKEGLCFETPTMRECATIMQNISFSSPSNTLQLLQYLLLVRKRPANYSLEDLQMIPMILNALAHIRTREASDVRTNIISQLVLPDRSPALVAQLSVHSPELLPRHLAYLNNAAVSNIAPGDSVQVISYAGVHLPFETLKLYIASALGSLGPHFIMDALEKGTRANAQPATGTQVIKTPLCDALECVFSALLTRMEVGEGVAFESERVESTEYILRVGGMIDWGSGVPLSSPRKALQRLQLFTKLNKSGVVVNAPEAIMKLIFTSLQLGSANTMANTLKSVIEALPLLPDDNQRSLAIEKMILFSGTRTTSSVIRFLALLSPLINCNHSCSSELVQQVVKLHTLNPYKLRQGSVESVTNGGDAFTFLIVRGISFLLTTLEWRTETQQLRDVMTAWTMDYLTYVMDPLRKQKRGEPVATEVGTVVENVDCLGDQHPRNVASHESEGLPAVSGPTEEELEQVFTCMLRAGIKLPEKFSTELHSRVHQTQKESVSSINTGSKTRVVPPSHFVFCCKLDIPVEQPSGVEILRHYLTECDCRIFHCVVNSFFLSMRCADRDAHSLLLGNLRLASQVCELLLERMENMGESASKAFYPASASSVVANTIRFVINHVTHQERVQRVLQDLNSVQYGEMKKEGNLESDTPLIAERNCFEESLTRLTAYLSDVYLKNLGMTLLDRLSLVAPSTAEYIMLRVTTQLSSFTEVELFYLVQKYPRSQEKVISMLKKSDLALTVGLNDFVRVLKKLPMPINAMVIEAHLPNLNFQWCTRLLSSLAMCREIVPLKLLGMILNRLDEVAGTATVTDRHMALAVVQKHLQLVKLSNECSEREETLDLLKRSCDRLMVLHDIVSLDGLKEFLSEFPDALSGAVSEVFEEHVVEKILGGLFEDLDGLLTFCRLVRQHKLLSEGIKQAVIRGFFMHTLANNTRKNSSSILREQDTVGASTGAVTESTFPLSNVLALALLLCEDGMSVPTTWGEASVQHGKESDDVDVIFRVVRKLYASPKDKLHIAASLAEQKSSARCMALAREVCMELVEACEGMTSNEFSKLLQYVSRLGCWPKVNITNTRFDETFIRSCVQADAHSRCVIFKAISFDGGTFRMYESFMIPLLQEVVDVMSDEDIETVLSSIINLQFSEPLESLIDTIGTRLLTMVDRCRRSTLIRLLQCHAVFGVRDDFLVGSCVTALAEQCGRDVRLDTNQALTVLQAAVDLDFTLPPRLATYCFSWLEHHIDNMTISQLGKAVRLAVDVEVGYTAPVHTLALRALEQREAIRSNASFREAVELLCHEFSAEIPWHQRAHVIRKRYQSERLLVYFEKQKESVTTSTE
uniref:Uncharacterized protein n=1 Tax=Trypanosoma congolense (strain IL3000) TaxID=1068625 RepID=G0UX86_TRYCI|nr:conserved hypothetical protein [Trypanosoma congolense IL3000]